MPGAGGAAPASAGRRGSGAAAALAAGRDASDLCHWHDPATEDSNPRGPGPSAPTPRPQCAAAAGAPVGLGSMNVIIPFQVCQWVVTISTFRSCRLSWFRLPVARRRPAASQPPGTQPEAGRLRRVGVFLLVQHLTLSSQAHFRTIMIPRTYRSKVPSQQANEHSDRRAGPGRRPPENNLINVPSEYSG
jgi:hypothetical protein